MTTEGNFLRAKAKNRETLYAQEGNFLRADSPSAPENTRAPAPLVIY